MLWDPGLCVQELILITQSDTCTYVWQTLFTAAFAQVVRVMKKRARQLSLGRAITESSPCGTVQL